MTFPETSLLPLGDRNIQRDREGDIDGRLSPKTGNFPPDGGFLPVPLNMSGLAGRR